MSDLPFWIARNTIVRPSGENAGFSCWSRPGIGMSFSILPFRAFKSISSRPRSRRTKTAIELPSGETARSTPPTGPVVSHWATMYSYSVL